MRSARSLGALLACLGLAALGLGGSIAAAGAATQARTTLKGSATPASERANAQGSVPASATVSFVVSLPLRNATGAKNVVRQVSDPASASYRHFLTDAQWESRFGPTASNVSAATSWLRSQGFAVGALPKAHLFIPVHGTAAQVEKAFSTTLSYYKVNGNTVRLADGPLSVPSSVAGSISGVVGVNQYLAKPDSTTGAATGAATGSSPSSPSSTPTSTASVEPPPPAGFRNPQPCSGVWGQKIDTADSASLYAPFTAPLPYDICGYKPNKLRAGYNLNGFASSGTDGSGVQLAIVDAYESPTLLSDAQTYSKLNDPAYPLKSSQFSDVPPSSVGNAALCDGSGWFSEQSLDVESSHAMAPGADILYVGARDCFDDSLLAALTTAVTSGASVVSNSWGDTLGDLLSDSASKAAFDNTFMLADATGVSVLFSSGDAGDNFANTGIDAPDFPATSPFITSVGGTTLEVGSAGARQAEYGWSTAKQTLCVSRKPNCGKATTPAGPLAWQAGGGGGTSYTYTQPYYQQGVVPQALALRNQALFGPQPLRVEPDISLDADAQSGMLIGLTQTFPDGVYYDQFKEGGTSLASPLLAGVIADADQAAGQSLGFLNPTLYKAYKDSPSAFNDIVAPSDPKSAAVIRTDYANTVDNSNGYVVSLRAISYAGIERYCDGTNNCASRRVTLTARKGFDSLTGLGSVGPRFISVLKNF
jgi:subtilase family serine protease